MVGKEINDKKLGSQFAEKIGEIVKVRGPMVDVQVHAEQLPHILDSITVESGESTSVLSVTQRLGSGRFRCVAVTNQAGLQPGSQIVAVESETANQIGPEALSSLVQAIRSKSGPIIETGIKAIDLFAPLTAKGVVGIFGIQGVGKAVLVAEIIRRLAHHPDGVTMVGLMKRTERALAKEMLADHEMVGLFEESGSVELLWLLSDLGCDSDYAVSNREFDAGLYCSPEKAAQGIWPAIEPLYCRSSASLPEDHQRVAEDARALLQMARATMLDAESLAYLAHGNPRRAAVRYAEFRKAKMESLSPEDRLSMTRARKLELFMAQPFIVAEPYNQRPGATVALTETLEACEGIMSGKYDDVHEEAFRFVGGMREVLAKAQ